MKKIRYIYYDKLGNVTDILSVKKKKKDNFIECNVKEVLPILSGKKGILDFIVSYDSTAKEYKLYNKTNIIRLKNSINLSIVPFEEKDTVIQLVVYPDKEVEVVLDMSKLANLHANTKNIYFEIGTEFRFVIKEADTNKLVQEIVIQANELLKENILYYNLHDHINPNNIIIYTYNTLDTYCWCIKKTKFISPHSDNIKFNIHTAKHLKEKDNSYHLIMFNNNNNIRIINNIRNLEILKVYEDIDFFIVDKYDPNILHDKFCISKKDLNKKIIDINIDLNIDLNIENKNILYNHKYISVLIWGK